MEGEPAAARRWAFRPVQHVHREGRKLLGDRKIVLALVARWSRALAHADESLKHDREFVLAAVARNGNALQYVDESMNSDVVLTTAKQNGWLGGALKFADESFMRDLVMAAVKQSGSSLFSADASLKRDRGIVLAAVTQDGRARQFADESLQRRLRLGREEWHTSLQSF
mmetsp:Transcript_14619/g.44301  ORF Transcript_14619/g.44301 Transcript_14619/m.44301 type:complete len:169 (-) Transcript_14619:1150-1656(-)